MRGLKRGIICLLLLGVTSARAIMAPKNADQDAKRFGLDKSPSRRKAPSAVAVRAFETFNAKRGGVWALRFNPRTGLPAALFGGKAAARPGRPELAAQEFLSVHKDILGVDPTLLSVERQNHGSGLHHILFRQSYRGIPVEFAAVKVHVDEDGSVVGVQSTYEPDLAIPTSPAVPFDAAARTAEADAGTFSAVRGAPTLVIVPLDSDGLNHLAWKMRVDGGGGGWRYYVDAVTGKVLFRYNVVEFASPCLSSGVVTGAVFDVDPSSTPGPVLRPFNNQYVYIGSNSTRILTGNDSTVGGGFFCGSVFGKVAMSLQGPFVSVSEFRGPNAHYDDGNGVWGTVATPMSSPHPYPNNAVLTSTIDVSGVVSSNTVEVLPVFNNFSVGVFSGGTGETPADITDNDQLIISDGANNEVAHYVGARGTFNGAAVHGRVMHLILKSNGSGQESGYDIAISSYLTLNSPDVDAAPLSSHTWTYSDTWISNQQGANLHGEISLFYHLNLMHNYFFSDVDKSSAAPVVRPVVAMAHVGPSFLNALYDPDYDELMFGDVNANAPSDILMDDATVPRHEYTHYLVEKIWSIQNFGQAGAISEANADYWSASSLDDPAIGNYVVSSLGRSGPLRQIDDQVPGASYYKLGASSPYVGSWAGEIHTDSPFLSQALWDIRRANIARLGGHDSGRSCTDGLVFQSLLYFPESFSEMYENMLQVDSLGAVASCGGANASHAIITTAFANHGIAPIAGQGDAYDPNNGFETAVDISTIGTVSATIYPAGDTDFYSFGAGPGLIQLTLNLPSVGAGLYKDYQILLYNASRHQVASAAPPANGPGTLDGFCNSPDCQTTASSVVLSYSNPSGGLFYVQVAGGTTGASNSGVNSTTPYTLSAVFPRAGALAGSVVAAKFDNDVIAFTVNTSTFVSRQDWSFVSAQLRDQAHSPLPSTLTHVPIQAGDFLAFVSSASAHGLITGSVQISTGFAARFPSAGTVYLEVFAYDVHGSTSSMGESNAMNLTDNQNELTAYNNLFNPLKGQKTTVKYGVSAAGHLTITLYTVTGRKVLTLFDGDVTAGKGSVDWNGQNLAGNVVASGIYVVRAVGPGLNATKKIAVIK